jgi:hypothetical protein
MKFCKDCKYYSEGYRSAWCHAPQNGYSVIDGSINAKLPFLQRNKPLQYAGMREEKCGPDALYFEEKPVSKKPWYKFWS